MLKKFKILTTNNRKIFIFLIYLIHSFIHLIYPMSYEVNYFQKTKLV